MGDLVHAQVLDDQNLVISETYKFDGEYHFFTTGGWGHTRVWSGIDEDTLETLRDYQRLRVQKKLTWQPWGWSELKLKLARLLGGRSNYYKVKSQLDETEDLSLA